MLATKRRMKGQCRRILMAFAMSQWRVDAPTLNALGPLNYRGRISDLRHKWGIGIRAHSVSVDGKKHTTYVVPEADRQRATALLEERAD